MNDTNVSQDQHQSAQMLLKVLGQNLDEFTPEVRKAAAFVLEYPQEVGVSSIREIANAANVKPNTFMRMAHQVGLEGYDEFREPFREEIRNGEMGFRDRAEWLQALSKGGQLSSLYAEMAASTIRNIEQSMVETEVANMKRAADLVVKSRKCFVLGVGVNNTLARNFTYLASMALDHVSTIPSAGGNITDELAGADGQDVLIAMTFKPYRSEIVSAIDLAKEQGLKIIGISDSSASPIITKANVGLVVQAETPQFFPSSVPALALLETLMAFIVADADMQVVAKIEQLHKRRYALGIYQLEEEAQR